MMSDHQQIAVPSTTTSASSTYTDNMCVALLGMAESFRLSNPPRIRLAVKCLQAMFQIPMSPQMSTVAHFHLGKLLHHYTNNRELAKINLERAYQYALNMDGFEEIRVHVASLLADIYQSMRSLDASKHILRQELDMSRSFPFWYCRILFQLADLYARTEDVPNACQVLDMGVQYATRANIVYMETLFLLTKGILVTLDQQLRTELHQILERVHQLIPAIPGSQMRREELKTFFLILQVCYFLSTGAVKSAKPCLKQLQTMVQRLSNCSTTDDESVNVDAVEMFRWLSRENMTTVTYVVTVAHALQCGEIDRMSKYCDRALAQVNKLRQLNQYTPPSVGSVAANDSLLMSFEVLLLENSAMGRLVMGQCSSALREITSMIRLMSRSPALFASHESQSHALLGLYAMSMRCSDEAEKQFNTALRTAKDTDLWTLVNLNLAIVYLLLGRDQDFYDLLSRITPERLQSSSQTLLASSHFVRGLQSFLQCRNQEAKMFLKDSLAIANKENIMRISAATVVLLGHLCLSSNVQDCSSMLLPGLEMASKIPDVPLQAWATSLLHEMHVLSGDVVKATEAKQISESYANRLETDRCSARESPVHRLLLQWTEGLPTQLL